MTHVTPFVIQAGRAVQGSSLGYHAYSLRVDNLSNQWYQEESTLVWIPPYSLGVVLRLWGTSVALILPSSPVGQPQLAAIPGEYAVAVFSDELRTENPGVPVRQFTLVQAVSDLTMGPQPARPPVGVDRIYADPQGNIHHLHSDGTDLTLYDASNIGAVALNGDVIGTIGSNHYTNPSIFPGIIRAGPAGAAPPAGSGVGVELFNSGSIAYVQSWDRTAGNPATLQFVGNPVQTGSGTPVYINGPFTLQQGISPAMASGGTLYWHNNQTVYTYLNYPNLTFQNCNLVINGGSGGPQLQVNGTLTATSTITTSVNFVSTGGSLILPNNGQINWGSTYSIWCDTTNDIMYFRIPTGGAYYFYNPSVGANTTIDSAGNFVTNGWMAVNGNTLYLEGSHAVYIQYNSAYAAVYAPYGNGFVSPFFKALSGFVATNGWSNTTLESGYLISCWGSAMGAAWSIRSSRKLKSNLAVVDDGECLRRIVDPSVNVYSFQYLENDDARIRIGFMADEVHPIAPEFAFVDPDTGEPNAIEYGQMTAMLWGAVRRLAARVEELEGAAV